MRHKILNTFPFPLNIQLALPYKASTELEQLEAIKNNKRVYRTVLLNKFGYTEVNESDFELLQKDPIFQDYLERGKEVTTFDGSRAPVKGGVFLDDHESFKKFDLTQERLLKQKLGEDSIEVKALNEQRKNTELTAQVHEQQKELDTLKKQIEQMGALFQEKLSVNGVAKQAKNEHASRHNS